MTFHFRPAVRESAAVLVGLAGASGSGKTMSAMRLATGLAGGKRFCVIDTENGRALHYADDFEFDHGELRPPFRPERYSEAIKEADAKGYPVIMVDSASHEHAGEGGLLDWHEAILDKMAGADWKARERATFTAWVEPKTSHKAFVNTLLQVKAHVILCFRAEEKIEIVKVDGKTQVIPKRSPTGLHGWIPVAEKNLPYEMTMSFLLTADKPGFPQPIKLQAQHSPFVPLDQPLSEATGERLREWAEGGAKKAGAAVDSPPASVETDDGSAAALAEELLALADKLGAREATEQAITSNAQKYADDPGKRIAWLKRQIATATKNVEAKT